MLSAFLALPRAQSGFCGSVRAARRALLLLPVFLPFFLSVFFALLIIPPTLTWQIRELLAQELNLDSLDRGDQTVLGLDLKTLRSGVVVKTWWEQEVDRASSDDWRN